MTAPELRRRLGTADAVLIGLASMIGAGVFAVFGPAAGGNRCAVRLTHRPCGSSSGKDSQNSGRLSMVEGSLRSFPAGTVKRSLP